MAKATPRHAITACDRQFLAALSQIESVGADACRRDDSPLFTPGTVMKLVREAERCYTALRLPLLGRQKAAVKRHVEEAHSGGRIEF